MHIRTVTYQELRVRVQVPEMSAQANRGQADHLEVFSAHAHEPANSRGGLASNSRFGPDRAVNSRAERLVQQTFHRSARAGLALTTVVRRAPGEHGR
jgi:hypothetical protein